MYLLFFSKLIADFHAGYRSIFQVDDEETDKEDAESGEGKETEGVGGSDESGGAGFIYLSLIKEVSELTREPWSHVFEMSVIEFFNYINFSRWDKERERRQAEEWQLKHRAK